MKIIKHETKIFLIALLIVLAIVTVMPKVEDLYRKDVAKKVVARWRELAEKYAAFYKLDAKITLAMICQESGGNPDSVNPADPSRGLMQLTPGALADFNKALSRSYSFDDMFIPYKNIEVGTWYYATRLSKTGDTYKAIAAYNAGLGNIPAGYAHADKVTKYLRFVNEIYSEAI